MREDEKENESSQGKARIKTGECRRKAIKEGTSK